MIHIKDIEWIEVKSKNNGNHGDYHIASVRGYQFLQLHKMSPGETYYIHITFPTFKIYGNKGLEQWGLLPLDDAKNKAEEIISEEILSFIDMRDYKINEIIN
jgi:hypothetical protein